MKLIATTVGAVVAAVVVAATSFASAADEGDGRDLLYGGGTFEFDFDPGPGELVLPRVISIHATSREGHGTGTRFYGNPNRPTPAPAVRLECLRIEGNRAVVGNVSTDGVVLGAPSVQYFEDNGPPGPDPSDRITPVFLMTPEEAAELVPRTFPRTCPAPTPPAAWGTTWTDLSAGDLVVRKGPEGDD